MRHTIDELMMWLNGRGGIAHRDEALRAGFALALVRALVRSGAAQLVRRAWIALPTAPPDLLAAALAGARVTCVSLARRRGWWLPEGTDDAVHLHLLPGSRATAAGVRHWSSPLAPAERTLVATIEDALSHIAVCVEREAALVLWESAVRVERLAPEYLRAIDWTSRAARELAHAVTGLSDSGLETLLVVPLRRWGLHVRQQVVLAGRPVDLLIGERLVVQIDGWAFHSSSAQRASDIAHDAELRLRGYTVLRFAYAQVVHDRARVQDTIRRAVAAGLHLAA